MIAGRRGSLAGDPVDRLRRNFLTACHCQDDSVPVPSASIIEVNASHREDYPSPAVTRYLDDALEAAQLVPCAHIKSVIGDLARDPSWYRHFWAAGMLDLAQNPLPPAEAARRLGVRERRLYRMRREFWEAVYERVTLVSPP